MTSSTVSVRFTGSASDLLKMFEDTASAGDSTASSISGTFTDAAAQMSEAMSAASDRIKAALAETASGDLSADELRDRFAALGGEIDASITDAMATFSRETEDGMAKATLSVDAFKDKYTSAMLQMAAVTAEANGEEDVSEGFNAATNAAGGLFGRLATLTSSIPLVGEALKTLSEHLGEAESSGTKFKNVMTDVGKLSLVAGAAIAAGVAAESIHLASENQKATTTLAANADITVASAKKISNAFLDTAGTSIFSGTEMTAAYSGVAAQLSTVTGKALDQKQALDVMTASSDLAEASGTNLATSTSALASVMQAFGIQASGAASTTDILFNASRMTGQGIGQFTTAMDRMRTQLGSAAPPLSQMGGLLVDLTEHGETGRASMTILSTALQGVITPSKAVSKAQEEMGVSFVNSKGQLDPLKQIIGEAHTKIAGMGDAQAVATLKSLGFGAASSKLLPVIEAGSGAFDAATAAVSKTGSAHEAAEKQAKTLDHQVEILKATFEDLGTKLGNVLIPILSRVGQVVAGLTNFFLQHKSAVEVVAAAVGGVLVAAVGAYVVSLGPAIAATATLMLEWTPVVALVAGVSVAIYELATHWKQVMGDITSVVKDAWKDITGVFSDGIKTVENLFTALPGKVMTGVISPVVGYFKALPQQLLNGLGSIWSVISGTFTSIVTDVNKDVITPVVNFFEGLPDTILGKLAKLPGEMLSFGENIAKNILNGLGNIGSEIANKLTFGLLGGGAPAGTYKAPTVAHAGTPGRAAGGPVWPGQTFMVGENGPELAQFTAPAVIYPNSANRTKSPGGGVTQNFNLTVAQMNPSPAMLASAIGFAMRNATMIA